MWRYHTECKYMFMFSLKNLASKGLIYWVVCAHLWLSRGSGITQAWWCLLLSETTSFWWYFLSGMPGDWMGNHWSPVLAVGCWLSEFAWDVLRSQGLFLVPGVVADFNYGNVEYVLASNWYLKHFLWNSSQVCAVGGKAPSHYLN